MTTGNSKVPLFLDGTALEHVPEEDDCAPDGDDGQTDPDDPCVHRFDRQSQEEDTNAQLDEHHVEDISRGRQSLPLIQ